MASPNLWVMPHLLGILNHPAAVFVFRGCGPVKGREERHDGLGKVSE
jgi:hypothetical protein